jgi:hypothetical protein
MTIEEAWLANGQKPDVKLRYEGWDYQVKYFQVEGYNEKKTLLEGSLDNGEKICYPVNSPDWCLYEEKDEDMAKAV